MGEMVGIVMAGEGLFSLSPSAPLCVLCAESGAAVSCVSEWQDSHTETSGVICPLALAQLKALQSSYGRLQQDIFQFQRNQTSLEKKFSYDL